MFIFATYTELWVRELVDRIMSYEYSLGQNNILKFIYCFMILFFYSIYFKYFLLLV
jgi:hypothetical protein